MTCLSANTRRDSTLLKKWTYEAREQTVDAYERDVLSATHVL